MDGTRLGFISKAFFLSSFLFLCSFLYSEDLSAYTSTVTSSGTPVRWPGDSIHFELAGNPQNQTELSHTDFYTAVVHGLQRWTKASGDALSFDYWQGTDAKLYPALSAYDGISMIYFASAAKLDPHLSNNVLGLTQVWYDANTGRVFETDIALNDRDFRFTTNPHDTSGYGSGSSSFSNGKSTVFIENVITHELGHAFGLSHSGGLQSTMLFMESPEQAHLSCDDEVGIHALYPSSDHASRGSIDGQILNEMGNPVIGAHVVAISRRRGNVLASGLTNQKGLYSIAALEPGIYFLMVEPFFAGPQTLPTYYSGMRSNICPNGTTFGRTLLAEPSHGAPQSISVRSGQNTQAPPITVLCRPAGGAMISMHSTSSSMSTAPTLYSSESGAHTTNSEEIRGFGGSDQLNINSPNYYRLQGIQGNIEIHALSYSLYSPARPILTLLDANGKSVSVTTLENVYQGDSGYVNFDSAIYADSLPLGSYFLKITSTELDISLYPAGPIALDQIPFLIITGSINEPNPVLMQSLANNARCQMEENFGSYSSPPGDPPRHSPENQKNTGFCAPTTRSKKQNDSEAALIAGWFLPFILMGFITWLLKRSRLQWPLHQP